MKILFERTGGFAGKKLEGLVDSSKLSVSQARRLKDLLKRSGFFQLPSAPESTHPSADHFNYRVTVESEEGRHTIEAGETAIPGSMRPLLDFLVRSLK